MGFGMCAFIEENFLHVYGTYQSLSHESNQFPMPTITYHIIRPFERLTTRGLICQTARIFATLTMYLSGYKLGKLQAPKFLPL